MTGVQIRTVDSRDSIGRSQRATAPTSCIRRETVVVRQYSSVPGTQSGGTSVGGGGGGGGVVRSDILRNIIFCRKRWLYVYSSKSYVYPLCVRVLQFSSCSGMTDESPRHPISTKNIDIFLPAGCPAEVYCEPAGGKWLTRPAQVSRIHDGADSVSRCVLRYRERRGKWTSLHLGCFFLNFLSISILVSILLITSILSLLISERYHAKW